MSLSENKITEKILTDQINTTIPQGKLFDLQSIENKRVEVGFTDQDVSSDGGLLLIKDIEDRIGIVKAITSCMVDNRHQSYVRQSFEEIIVTSERGMKPLRIHLEVDDQVYRKFGKSNRRIWTWTI